MSRSKGFTLVEAIVYVAIFSIMMTFIVTMSVSSDQLFRSGAASVDIQESINKAFMRLSRDLQESNPASIGIDYVTSAGGTLVTPTPGGASFPYYNSNATPQITTAIIMLSARHPSSNNHFDYYMSSPAPVCSGNPGIPCWHKWVCYYLCPDPSSNNNSTNCPNGYTGAATSGTVYALVRAESTASSGTYIKAGSSATQTLPVLTPGFPNPSSGTWESIMRGVSGVEVLATNLDRFGITNPTSAYYYNDPFEFDAPIGGNSIVNFAGLRYYWVNVEGKQFQSLTTANKSSNQASNSALIMVRN